jgi:hypothetical protein
MKQPTPRPAVQRHLQQMAASSPARNNPERELHLQVANALRLLLPPAVVWFHVPNGEKRSKGTGALLKGMGVLAGVHDLLFMIPALPLHSIELKPRPGMPLEDEQVTFAAHVVRCGGETGVAYSVDDVLALLGPWLAKAGLSLRGRLA